MITVAVCDDSKPMVEAMREKLEEYGKETAHELRIFTFSSGEEFLENYSCKYDILFLDIKMNGMNGIQVAEKIREKDKKVIIIFLTSLIQYALDGYRVNAANYIIKPINKKRLKMEMDHWISELIQREEPFITVHNDSGIYKILLKSISYIETYNRNLMIHTTRGNILCYWKLREIESKISQYGFARNHASFLVNLYFVENIEKMDIKLSTGELIPIGKSKKKAFMQQLASYWGTQV
ncbi:response regulator transcription factor [[Ruminococcus] gnavus]|jgi:DNA-binding LytR/AlgR family response regulator|uniref:Stage 0 sporulation protein A homolog n=1 Tax=Mediterraneibacter gnavus TaxID=33038 RepID=A0AAJ1AZF2_MEDGN|nr:LytTR family DNA-binding domain-containing protein [Mediterraneibacter gnavus]MBN2920367.1 response regulator transcription factor [Lactobacillus sp.]MCC3679161.1 LytTR family DNA-binding domain-containing protein [[Clostridium] nexile]MCB5495025.1 LytTR family DNA-binding domain-containing protein [Mediterraneibacter gnavus]MCB5594292.1 LytTR family DNA-binding domain-containing protein [Mediterraneibacter gnavus]MCB5606992.1 LytTR family DNA-binding domain-containing protein [Mediterranei